MTFQPPHGPELRRTSGLIPSPAPSRAPSRAPSPAPGPALRRRIIAVALPHLAAEARLRREGQPGFPHPFAIAARIGGALRLASVNPAAAAIGLAPGLGLADARALCPGLVTRPAEPKRLTAFRRGLARWAGRFSPITGLEMAPESVSGGVSRKSSGNSPEEPTEENDTLILDATGVAHLFGGEAAMLEAVAGALAERGLTTRAAIADTKGAAWALAWFGVSERERPRQRSLSEPTPASHSASPPSHQSSPSVPSVAGWGRGRERHGSEQAGERAGGGTAPAKTTGEPASAPPSHHISLPGRTRAAIGGLPVAALRLPPRTAQGLATVGLLTIEDAARVPRGALARRFGLAALKRLDQALGAEPEPVAPFRPQPVFATRLTLPEPIGRVDDVMAGLARLLERLCAQLETHAMGARRLRLTARRVDGADTGAEIALARPGRDPKRLAALFEPRVREIEAGYGIDALRLEATAAEPLAPAQTRHQTRHQAGYQTGPRAGAASGPAAESDRLADLLSRIGNRIGFDRVLRFLPAASHIPERAFTQAAAAWSEPEAFPPGPQGGGPARPLTLFPPEPVTVEPGEALGEAPPPSAPPSARPSHPPGHPPHHFRWRGRRLTLARAQGPERLAPEWWWDDPAWRSGTRDYWRVETAEGPRLWLFRTPETARPGWWVHGEFA